MASASPEIGKSRVVAVKSPSTFHDSLCSLYPDFLLPGSASVSVGLPMFCHALSVLVNPAPDGGPGTDTGSPRAGAGLSARGSVAHSRASPAGQPVRQHCDVSAACAMQAAGPWSSRFLAAHESPAVLDIVAVKGPSCALYRLHRSEISGCGSAVSARSWY